MSYPTEKADSLTDVHFDTKEMGFSERLTPLPSGYDITQTQCYDLKRTKMDLIYSGAYSLRVHGTDTEVWSVKINTKSIEIFGADGSPVGTAGLKCWSGKVPVSMQGGGPDAEFTMTGNGHGIKGFFGERKGFEVQGQKLMWQRAAKVNSKFELVDEAGTAYAWIGATSWKGHWQLRILKPGMTTELVQACVVTALAIAETEKRNVWAVSTGAAASS